jgi:tRNA(Ile)-lysidine synthase
LIELKADEEHIPILKLKKLPSYKIILWEIIKEKHFTAGQVDEVIKLMDADTGRYIDSEDYRIIRNRKWMILTRKPTTESNHNIVIDTSTKKVTFSNRQLTIENVPNANFQIPTSSNIACVDAKDVVFPLLLRKAKQGDYFYPLGMKKKKKLSRFLIDQKLSKTDKENVWILETNKKIIWVVGYRIDERFKIDENSKAVLKISLNV